MNVNSKETLIKIGTGGPSGVYFQVGNTICKMVAKLQSKEHGRKSGSENTYFCSAPSTGGSNYNIGKILQGDLDFGVSQSDWQSHAYKGTSKWSKIGPSKNLRSVFSFHNEPFQIWVRKKAKVNNFRDLKGKIVNIGNPGSGQRRFMEELMRAYGVDKSFFKKTTELTSSEQIRALCDGRIDAFGYAVGFPNGAMEQAATCRAKATPISIDKDIINKLVQNNTSYSKAVIPKGTYTRQKKDIITYGVKATLVTNKNLSNEIVYDVVKSVFENLDHFQRQHPAFRSLNSKMMLEGLSAPLHAGAIKYYKEAGISYSNHLYIVEKLPNKETQIAKAEPSQTQSDKDLEEEKKKIAEEKRKIEEQKRKIAEVKKKQEEEKKRKEEQDDIYVIGSGTGFFVNKEGYVITNNHVVEICRIMAAKIGGKAKLFEILATDTSNDLAIIKGEFRSENYLNLSTVGAVFGEDVVAFGYPLDSELSSSVKLTRGIVSSLSGPENNISQIQIDAAIQPGNSGGPVLNYQGQVVGVASAGLNKLYMLEKAEYIPENVNFAVAAPTLLAFLKANQIDFGDKKINVDKTQELAKIGMPSTIQLKCLNTKSAHQKHLKNKKYNDVLLRKVVDFDQEILK